jgi:hypothetical protein
MCLWCCWKDLDEQDVGDIDFKVISTAGNANKFQKTRFWKEISG